MVNALLLAKVSSANLTNLNGHEFSILLFGQLELSAHILVRLVVSPSYVCLTFFTLGLETLLPATHCSFMELIVRKFLKTASASFHL